jgi:hypothetical protein
MRLDSFLTGSMLLSGLFLYDIFWVFGSTVVTGGDSVMVAVAKGLDAPVKVRSLLLLGWTRSQEEWKGAKEQRQPLKR